MIVSNYWQASYFKKKIELRVIMQKLKAPLQKILMILILGRVWKYTFYQGDSEAANYGPWSSSCFCNQSFIGTQTFVCKLSVTVFILQWQAGLNKSDRLQSPLTFEPFGSRDDQKYKNILTQPFTEKGCTPPCPTILVLLAVQWSRRHLWCWTAGLIPGQGAETPHALHLKNQNIKQKQNCNKFNKDLKK